MGMGKNRSRSRGSDPKLEMTPMIDVVFQLLIFFIVTLKQEDILSHLDVSRPAPDPNQKPIEKIEDLLTITVYRKGFVMDGRKVNVDILDQRLTKLASFSKSLSIVIKCTGDSPHQHLVELLDICAKNQLTNLSVFSM